MRTSFGLPYEGPVYRPPSEADSLIVQATIGCSWNHCTYCAMYRHKQYRERPLEEILSELRAVSAAVAHGHLPKVRRIFVGDGDALAMPTEIWVRLLAEIHELFPGVTRISCYATARNLLEKTPAQLRLLRDGGLKMLYIGPESGDDVTLKAIAKGGTFADHVEAGRRAREAEMAQSLIFLLGAGGVTRSTEHARSAGRLATEMDPRYVSLLTLTVVPQTPLFQLSSRGRFQVPEPAALLREIQCFLQEAEPSNAVFRTNHASNYLPLSGRLPRDRERLLAEVESALAGKIPLRAEFMRGL